jgi:tRNA A37 threonylcarbamoyladenosine dehydratase
MTATNDLHWLERSRILIGDENIQKLQQSHVLVIGLGGVGSFAAELIARSGVGSLTIADGDVVDPTNRNRQLPALATNHGQYKVDIMAKRLLQINPALKLHAQKEFLQPERMEEMLAPGFDYVVDAIDSLSPKLMLLTTGYQKGLKIVSSMGAGGKLDPTQVRVADIADTKICKLAYDVRKRLRKSGIHSGITAVYSAERVVASSLIMTDGSNFKKSAYGTISYLPAVFGCTCASVVIRDLIGKLEVGEG